VLIIPNGYNYPIDIQAKTEPRITGFSEGYQQRSGFDALRSTTLNYLGLSKAAADNLLAAIDAAGAVDKFEWHFRPHYINKFWVVDTYRTVIHDKNRVDEITLELKEYPRSLPGITPPTTPLLLDLVPDQAPTITTNYRTRSPNLGRFYDRKREPLNGKVQTIQMQKCLSHEQADEIDLLLDRCRGVYPLLWESDPYTCSDWRINYQPEFAEIDLTLQTVVMS
jgi:phage-related protein